MNKLVFRTLLLFILVLAFIFNYFSPIELKIKLHDIMNSKLYLSENHAIFLPKGWFYTVIGIEQQNAYFILENIVLKSKIEKNNLTLIVQNKSNKGVIRFLSQKDKDYLVKNPYYTEHNGSNYHYKIYYKESQMDEIYIPKIGSILKFQNYHDKNVPKFINDFCKEPSV